MAIMYSTFLYIQRTALRRQDIGVQPEKVIGIVLPLDLSQALVVYTVGFLYQTFAVFIVAGHAVRTACVWPGGHKIRCYNSNVSLNS